MSSSVRRTISDALMFASGLILLVFALVATDARVRERASMLVSGGPPLERLAEAGVQLGSLARIAVHVVQVFSSEHSLLTIFAVVALVLVTAVSRLCPWH